MSDGIKFFMKYCSGIEKLWNNFGA